MNSSGNQDNEERAAETPRRAASTTPPHVYNPGQIVEINSSPDGSVVSPLFPLYSDMFPDTTPPYANAGYVATTTRGREIGDTFVSDEIIATSIKSFDDSTKQVISNEWNAYRGAPPTSEYSTDLAVMIGTTTSTVKEIISFTAKTNEIIKGVTDGCSTVDSAAHIPTSAYLNVATDHQNLQYNFSRTQPNTNNFIEQTGYNNLYTIDTTSINPDFQCNNQSTSLSFQENFVANNISLHQGNHTITTAEEPTNPPSSSTSQEDPSDANATDIKKIVELAADKSANRVIDYFKEIGFNKDLVDNIKKITEKIEGEIPTTKKRKRPYKDRTMREPRNTRRHSFKLITPMPSATSAFSIVVPTVENRDASPAQTEKEEEKSPLI